MIQNARFKALIDVEAGEVYSKLGFVKSMEFELINFEKKLFSLKI